MRIVMSGLAATLCLATGVDAATVGYVEFEGGVVERQMVSSLFMSDDMAPTLRDVTATFDEVAGRGLDGLVIRLKDLALTRGQIEEIGRSMDRIREAGTPIHVFTEIYGPGELLFASHADEVIVQAGGAVTLPGMYMQEMFLADALRWVGIEPDFIQIGDYKGASEMMANAEPSKAWDQNINQLLDSMYANMKGTIADGRNMSERQLEAAMETCFLASPETAMKHGLVDAAIDRLDLNEHLEDRYGDFDWDRSIELGPGSSGPDFANMGLFETFSTLMEMFSSGPASLKPQRDTIAVVHIDGAIVDGESSNGSLLGGATVGSLTIRKALKDLETDNHVKGVIVRINSPGGSAIASESIWRGLRRIAEDKPVWISVGDMAASGGYYIAVAGEKIYVNDTSIVGSIGVVGGKLAMRGLYEKLHINVVSRTRGPRAGVMSPLDEWTATESAMVRDKMTETYDLFVERVKAGRRGISIDKTAEGRLFTGDKAIALNMADKVGGIDDAIDDLAADLGLTNYDVMDFPGPMSFEEMLSSMFPFAAVQSGNAPNTRLSELAMLLREVVGPEAWPAVQDNLNALMQMRSEPVLLTSPRALIIP